jgi:hypothetical protein
MDDLDVAEASSAAQHPERADVVPGPQPEIDDVPAHGGRPVHERSLGATECHEDTKSLPNLLGGEVMDETLDAADVSAPEDVADRRWGAPAHRWRKTRATPSAE